jgi:hypothetical protein
MGILIWYSVVQARADIAFRQNNLVDARTAVRLAPGNALYHANLAELSEVSGADPDPELKIASDLNPFDSTYWIRRAFRSEVQQRYDESERFLREAYRVDRGFDPRWALMNYYFRRGNLPEFWKSGTEAFAMSYGDLDPIFRLCLAASNNPADTRKILPERPSALVSFFTYLVRHEQIGMASAKFPFFWNTATSKWARTMLPRWLCGTPCAIGTYWLSRN